MKTHRCLVIDDEALARELMATHLGQLPEFELVGSCATALEAQRFLRTHEVELLFLDIEMPVLKGTDFLKGLHHPPKVIFTTAYRHYALDGFDLDAVDYLLKPITFERFFQATEKYLRQSTAVNLAAPKAAVMSSPKFLCLRKDRKQIRLPKEAIDYLESRKDYVHIFHAGQETVVKYTLAKVEQLLGDGFLRIHRSFLINVDKVTAISKRDVELGAKEIPIGDLYRKRVFAHFGV
ncbi:MAG: response regulator transcription factor [Bacteroidota bacterium]